MVSIIKAHQRMYASSMRFEQCFHQ